MTRYVYPDGSPVREGDRVRVLGITDMEFEVCSYRFEQVAVIGNVTPGFKAIGTSTVSFRDLTLVGRAAAQDDDRRRGV